MRTRRSEMLSIREILFGWRMARRPRSCLSGAPVVVRYGINVGMADIEFSSDCCWGNSSRPFCYHNALKWGHTPPFFSFPLILVRSGGLNSFSSERGEWVRRKSKIALGIMWRLCRHFLVDDYYCIGLAKIFLFKMENYVGLCYVNVVAQLAQYVSEFCISFERIWNNYSSDILGPLYTLRNV